MPRKYGAKASQSVKRAMHKMKRGKLHSGQSRRKVKNRKQAVAIGLSEARRKGAKVPPKTSRSRSKKTAGRARQGSSSSTARRPSSKRTNSRSSGAKSSRASK